MRRIKKRYRSRLEREAMVGEYVESGQTQVEFCQERGIGLSTLQYWLRKTAEAGEPAPAAAGGGGGFVELKVETMSKRAGDVRQARSPADPREYELVLSNGRRLVVRGELELLEVTALVSLLEERS